MRDKRPVFTYSTPERRARRRVELDRARRRHPTWPCGVAFPDALVCRSLSGVQGQDYGRLPSDGGGYVPPAVEGRKHMFGLMGAYEAGGLGRDHPGAIIPALSEAALPFLEPNFGFPSVCMDGARPSRPSLVPDDMRLRPELEGGARRMRADNRFDDVVWEKTSASEHALRVRAVALESQGRDIPDEKVVVTYISRQSSRRRLRDQDHTALVALLKHSRTSRMGAQHRSCRTAHDHCSARPRRTDHYSLGRQRQQTHICS
jgi:hypothetical protein